jgi:UDP-glucuronate 4-epimerase
MRIAVTGVAGFVGSRLSKVLLERGDSVVGLDNLNDYYALEHKQRHLADIKDHPRFRFVKADLREPQELAAVFADGPFDAVAHLAAMAAVRYSVEHPLIYGQVNVQGTMNLLEAPRKLATASNGRWPKFVMASTGSVYGADTPVPFRESSPADRPLAPYPASKRSMELMANAYHHLWKMPILCLRFFNVYGPHGRPDMMPWQWARQIVAGQELTLYDGGRLKRDWTYIDDIVAGFVAALDADIPRCELINLGCSSPVDNLTFVQILEELLGKKATVKDVPAPVSEPKITYADIHKAATLLHYSPKVHVQEGLRHFVDWMVREKLL